MKKKKNIFLRLTLLGKLLLLLAIILISLLFAKLFKSKSAKSVDNRTPHIENISANDKKNDLNQEETFTIEIDNRFESEQGMQSNLEGYLSNIRAHAAVSKDAESILNNLQSYPEEVLKLASNRVDALRFASEYINNKGSYISHSKNEKVKPSYDDKRNIPLYIQWDKRWGYVDKFGALFSTVGCAPTCIAMVLNANDVYADPIEIMQVLYDSKRFKPDLGTSWDGTVSTLGEYGFDVKPISNGEGTVKNSLNDGAIVLVNVGKSIFTTGGHYMLITEVNDEGKFLLNDPYSIRNSVKAWSYDELSPVIRGMWSVKRNQ